MRALRGPGRAKVLMSRSSMIITCRLPRGSVVVLPVRVSWLVTTVPCTRRLVHLSTNRTLPSLEVPCNWFRPDRQRLQVRRLDVEVPVSYVGTVVLSRLKRIPLLVSKPLALSEVGETGSAAVLVEDRSEETVLTRLVTSVYVMQLNMPLLGLNSCYR